MNWNVLVRSAQRWTANNSPLILTAIAVTGTITTAYLAGRASFKAADEIFYAERGSIGNVKHRELTPKDKFELTWKFYIPAAGTAALTVTAIIMSHHISSRRAAAMAAAFSISEKAFEEYKAKVIDKMGERKEQAVRDEIAQDRLNRNPVNQSLVIVGNGDVLCYDSYIDRYFLSNMEKLRKAQNDINFQILSDHYASLSDFYDILGLPHAQVSEEVGWNLDKELDIKYSTGMSSDNRPCIVISFEVSPARNYFRCL